MPDALGTDVPTGFGLGDGAMHETSRNAAAAKGNENLPCERPAVAADEAGPPTTTDVGRGAVPLEVVICRNGRLVRQTELRDQGRRLWPPTPRPTV